MINEMSQLQCTGFATGARKPGGLENGNRQNSCQKFRCREMLPAADGSVDQVAAPDGAGKHVSTDHDFVTGDRFSNSDHSLTGE